MKYNGKDWEGLLFESEMDRQAGFGIKDWMGIIALKGAESWELKEFLA